VAHELSRSADRVVLSHDPQNAPPSLAALEHGGQRSLLDVDAQTWPSAGMRGFNTLAIRTGHTRSFEGEHSEPIFETSSYVYGSCAESEAAFSGISYANVYSRFTNPTVHTFEKRLAALERAEMAVATASGMAALLAMFTTYLRAGDHVVCSQNVFGSTAILLRDYFTKFQVGVSFVPLADTAAWQAEVRSNTRLMFCETPSNPTLAIADIRALARIADGVGALLAVDNTFCSPCGQSPLVLGAHLVVHSAGKYIDGQGRCIGGVVAGSSVLMNKLRGFMRCAGPAMSAHNAWVFLKGLETLQLRMQRHSENAQMLAEWLSAHPRVTKVYYTGLRSHEQHVLARRQQRYHGGVLSFLIDGDRTDAWRCIDAMRMVSRTTNIGDAKTMVTHPASTTHLKLSQAQRDAAAVSDNLIRVAVGLEDIQDIVAEVDRGLAML
jgi:O-succinylhomoserine sulfhydrylase